MFYGNNNNNLRQSAEEKYKKEAERKRKEEYRKFLDLQLAEKERNKALEQQKRREEDIKFDNKINLQRQELQQQYHQYQIQNATNTYNNNNNNNINMDNRPQTYQNFNTQFQPSPPPKYISHNINKKDPNIESPENMFANPISSMPNFYPNTNQQLQLQMQQQQQQPLSSHEPNLQEYNMNNQIMYQQQQQPTFYMDQQQQQGNMGLQQQANANNLMYNTPPTFNRTGPIQQPYYTPQTTGPNVNVLMNSGNNAINPQVTEEILLTFANNQRDILKEYELKMKQYNENPETSAEQIKLIKDLYNERNNALDRIKQEQENLRNALGFYPWKAQLTEKLANLFDIILERKISIIEKNTTLKEQYLKQQQQQQHQRYSSSNTNQPNKNYLSSSLTQQNPQQSQSKQNYHLQRKNINSAYPSKHHTNNNYFPPLKESTTNYVDNNNNININNNNTSQINLDDLCYRSKYEDIKRSIMIPEDINPEFKASMAGFSKFVTARDNTNPNNKLSNPNNISNTTTYLYQTWRDQSQLNTLGNIKEVDEYRIIENKDNNVDLSQQSLSSSSQKRNIMNNKSNNNQSKCMQRSNNVKNSNAISKVSRCMESAKQMRISKEEKDKSLIFGMDQDDMMNIQGGSGGIVDDNINIQQSTIPTNEQEHEQGHEVLFKTIDAQKNNYCNPEFYRDEEDVIGDSFINRTNNNNNNSNSNRNQISTINNNNNTNEYSTMKEDNKHIIEETEVDEYNNYKFEHYSDEEEQHNDHNNEEGNKEDNEEDEYGNDFETDETEMKKMELKEESEKNNLNLDDYKEIHETQKIYTHMNFFEDSYIDPSANAGNANAKGNNKVGQLNRPKSPKFKKEHMNNNNNNYDNDVNNKSNLDSVFGRDVSQNYSINPIQDSYGDNIIKDLNRFRKMALEESEDFCNNDGSVIGSKYIK